MNDDRLARLVIDDVRPFEGRTFRITAREGQVFEAVLVEVSDETRPDGRHGPAGVRPPFSLTFRACDGQRHPQDTYSIETEGFAALDVFCTPIYGNDAAGRLQAVFH